jgi:hypothetical protein
VINGTTFNVTALSNTLIVNVADGFVNQTNSGVLLDFNPTLVQIQATDADGAVVNYYVLVPSATAIVIKDLTTDHLKVGTIIKLGENHKVKIVRVEEDFKKNVTIVSASLMVDGNKTGLSISLKNEGNLAFRVFGITLHGEFETTQTFEKQSDKHDETSVKVHAETLSFKVDGSSLIPLFGIGQAWASGNNNRGNEDKTSSSLTLQPGESVTLTFNGVIALETGNQNAKHAKVITPVEGNVYTLRLAGEGYQTLSVTATS